MSRACVLVGGVMDGMLHALSEEDIGRGYLIFAHTSPLVPPNFERKEGQQSLFSYEEHIYDILEYIVNGEIFYIGKPHGTSDGECFSRILNTYIDCVTAKEVAKNV